MRSRSCPEADVRSTAAGGQPSPAPPPRSAGRPGLALGPLVRSRRARLDRRGGHRRGPDRRRCRRAPVRGPWPRLADPLRRPRRRPPVSGRGPQGVPPVAEDTHAVPDASRPSARDGRRAALDGAWGRDWAGRGGRRTTTRGTTNERRETGARPPAIHELAPPTAAPRRPRPGLGRLQASARASAGLLGGAPEYASLPRAWSIGQGVIVTPSLPASSPPWPRTSTASSPPTGGPRPRTASPRRLVDGAVDAPAVASPPRWPSPPAGAWR